MGKAMLRYGMAGAAALAILLMAELGAGATLDWSADARSLIAPPVIARDGGVRRLSLDPALIRAGPGAPDTGWRSYGLRPSPPGRMPARHGAEPREIWLLIGGAAPLDLAMAGPAPDQGIGRADRLVPPATPAPVPLPAGALLLLTGLAALCLAGLARSCVPR